MAEVLAAFSLATDLGMIQPTGHVLRACAIAMSIAKELQLPGDDQTVVYYATLLMHSGCTASAAAMAALFEADEQEIGRELAFVDPEKPVAMLSWMARHIASGQPLPARAYQMLRVMAQAPTVKNEGMRATCEVGARMARRLGLPPKVEETLLNLYERWDGRGFRRLSGQAIPVAARIVDPASQIEIFAAARGPGAAEAYVRREQGASLDPDVASAFLALQREPTFSEDLQRQDLKDFVLGLEPDNPFQHLDERGLDQATLAFAYFADIKSTVTLGHSTQTARWAEAIATRMGLTDTVVVRIRRAALLHDLGHVGVGSYILNKQSPLTEAEQERLRLHPYYAERILAAAPALRSLGELAGAHHEWLNGQGYYRGLAGAAIPVGAQIIAMADAYHEALDEPGAKVPRTPSDALAILQPAVGSHFAPECFEALAQVVDARPAAALAPAPPAGLTLREIEVLRVVARGLTNRQIAQRLVISEKTVGHHLEHIFDKLDVSTRSAAVFFALEHNLLT
jgi:HD-GYP domain-containing protein (c-di-GMP phosphodiesterase class II)